MSPQTIIRADRTVPWKRGTVRSAGRPRSAIYQFRDVRAYAVTLDYFPDEDRIFIGYSIGRPLIPEPWMVAEEDPLEGLWLDPPGAGGLPHRGHPSGDPVPQPHAEERR